MSDRKAAGMSGSGLAKDPVCGMKVEAATAEFRLGFKGKTYFFYNSIGVPVAAGVLYPFAGVLLSPVIAALAMSFSSVSVVANALRLRRVNLRLI